MKLKKCSARRIIKKSKRKKIICFCAGSYMRQICDKHKKLVEGISFVIDNNKNKIGTSITLNNRKIEIKSADELKNIDFSKNIILITTPNYKSVFPAIYNICGSSKCKCYWIEKRHHRIINIWRKIVCKLPLKDIIVFNGEGDTCENAMTLGKYISKNNYFGKYKLVWLCKHPEKFKNSKNEIYIQRKNELELYGANLKEKMQYWYFVSRAKYVIYENEMIEKQRETQICVYLTHGGPPIKNVRGLIVCHEDINYCLSSSEAIKSLISYQYSVREQNIMVCGLPRTDTLFNKERSIRLEENIQFKKYNKIILWVPTLRQVSIDKNRNDTGKNFPYGIPIIYLKNDYIEMVTMLEKQNILLILKPHYYQDMSFIRIRQSDNFKVITNNDLSNMEVNTYDLMKYADAMITDYSSISFDFMLLDRPLGYTIDDINEYKLGFSIPNVFDFMPGHHIENISDFNKFILDISNGIDEYKEQRDKLNKLVHDQYEGENCKRLCEKLGIMLI